MGTADRIVSVTITAQTQTVSEASLDVPLIAAYHTRYADRVRTYDISAGLAALIADGFVAGSAVYEIASALHGQNPSIASLKVGRCALAATQVLKLTPEAQNTAVYTLTINGVAFSFTSDASATVAEVVAGLVAAVNAAAWVATTAYIIGQYVTNDTGKGYVCVDAGTSAGSGGPTGTGAGIVDGGCIWDYIGVVPAVTAADATTYLTLSADVPGTMFTCEVGEDYDEADLWTRLDTTVEAGIATDLAAIALADNTWYGLCIDVQSPAAIAAAATWAEANNKLFAATSGDSAIPTNASSDIATTLSAANRDRTILVYDKDPHDRAAEAWMGLMFTHDAGSATWMFKTPSGPTAVDYSAAQYGYMEAKNCNYFQPVGGVDIMQKGKCASGEFIDVIHGLDWLKGDIQTGVYGDLVRLPKVPFTDSGAGLAESRIRESLERGVERTFISGEDDRIVTVPLVSTVSVNNRANRILPDVNFSARLAGALHSIVIAGVVTP